MASSPTQARCARLGGKRGSIKVKGVIDADANGAPGAL